MCVCVHVCMFAMVGLETQYLKIGMMDTFHTWDMSYEEEEPIVFGGSQRSCMVNRCQKPKTL